MNYRMLLVLFLFFFFFESVSAQTLQYPVFIEEARACEETGVKAYYKYGLNRVLLEWDFEKVTERMCEPLAVEGESGYFCDATQFSIMLFKRYESFRKRVQEYVSGLGEEESRGLFSIKSLSDLEAKTGLSADFNVLLLGDNYSEQFKQDFDSFYGGSFFGGKEIVISSWVFENSPLQTGFYYVSLEAPVSFDGESFGFSSNLNLKFELVESLELLDEKLGTEFQKNKLLEIPFDASIGSSERDYGSGSIGQGIQLNDSIYFYEVSGLIASLETEQGRNYEDTASGIVFGLGVLEEGEHSHYMKFNSSIPVVLSIHLNRKKTHKIYYAIGDSEGGVMPQSYYGERDYLLEWKTYPVVVRDSFPVQRPDIKCTGWDEDITSALLEIGPSKQGYLSYHSVAFFPQDSSFTVQCVSDENIVISMNSYDGESFGYYQSINPLPNQWLGGMRGMLKPRKWLGVFSLKDAIEEIKKGRICVIAVNEFIALGWNPDAFRGRVVVDKSVEEAEYKEAIEMNDLCRMWPADVRNVTNGAYYESGMKLFWCRPKQYCDGEGGFRFLGKRYDPCKRYSGERVFSLQEGEFKGSEVYCCYKPMNESERQCLEGEMNIYLEYDPPSPEFIEKILAVWKSPVLEQDDSEKMSIGNAFIHFNAEDWSIQLGDGSYFTKQYKFDPLISLAFFSYESGMATDPKHEIQRKSIGNIEKKRDKEGISQSVLCTNPSFERFCGYNEWWESVRHWAWLIEENYVDEGLETVRDILYKYAPPEENDTEEYIRTVKRRVCHWRELWKEYKQRESEKEAVAAQIEIPNWLSKTMSGVTEFVKDYVMFWEKDADNDGIIDLKDACPKEPETFNRYKDRDGCPDEVEKKRLERSGELKSSRRSERIKESKKSIYNKKVMLFVPIDFQHSDNRKFKNKAKKYFDKFIEIAGLKKLSGRKIVLVADDVLEYGKVKPCDRLRTERAKYTVVGYRKISDLRRFWRDLDACGKNYLRKKYGYLPRYSDYRIVALINTTSSFWYFAGINFGQVKGVSLFGKRGPKNSVISTDWGSSVSHELGHTFGFAEQYSAKAYLSALSRHNYIKNYYPGSLQKHFNLKKEGVPSLYKRGYPRGTDKYPTCSYNKGALKTNCPDWPKWLSSGAVDCLGRKLPRAGLMAKRSVMGPSSLSFDFVIFRLQTQDYGFDCFEQSAIQRQWGR